MSLETADDVIGETIMVYKGSEVSIRVHRPVQAAPGEAEFHCRYFIVGGTLDHKGRVIGLDSMQALILCLRHVGTYIQCNDEIDTEGIEWPGGPLEFPEFSNLR